MARFDISEDYIEMVNAELRRRYEALDSLPQEERGDPKRMAKHVLNAIIGSVCGGDYEVE